MVNPKASRAATVFTGGVAFEAEQPSMFNVLKVPLIIGGVLSSTFMICMAVVLFEHPSVMT